MNQTNWILPLSRLLILTTCTSLGQLQAFAQDIHDSVLAQGMWPLRLTKKRSWRIFSAPGWRRPGKNETCQQRPGHLD